MSWTEIFVHIVIYTMAIVVGTALSYALAKVGQPNAVWIWRDLLGVI